MTGTLCFFNRSNARCKGANRKNIPMLACSNHLKEYYGLELGDQDFDNEAHIGWVSGFLKPIKNYSIFKRNTVIIPTCKFFDYKYRFGDSGLSEDEKKNFRKYIMNPRIEEFMRIYQLQPQKSHELRLIIEMYRHFMDNETSPAYNKDDELVVLQTLLATKKVITETEVKRLEPSKIIKDFYVYQGKDCKSISDLEISLTMKYFLTNMLYSEQQIEHHNKTFTSYLEFNVQLIPNVGLVTTEQIQSPLLLVMDGKAVGGQIFYEAHATIVPKKITPEKSSLNDLPSKYALDTQFKSGKVLCP